MAQLTWRNVDVPSFSSVTDSYRLMGQLMNQGFDTAREALGQFQDYRTQDESGRLMQAVMAASDPSQVQDIVSRFNPSLVSPDAFKFAAGRPQDMASLDQTRVNTQGQRISNDFYTQYNPLRLDAQRTANEQSLVNLDFDRQNNPLRLDANRIDNAQSGFNLVRDQERYGREKDENAVLDEAKKLYNAAFQSGGSAENALRLIRGSGASAAVQQQALALGAENFPALFGPVPEALTGSVDNLISYSNQNATRNKPLAPQLTQAIAPVLDSLGVRMEVVSGGQDGIGEGDRRTGSTRHDHGGAADVRFYDAKTGRMLDSSDPNDLPRLQEIVRQGKARGITGWGAGEGYMGKGMMHLGFGNPGVWGAGGKGENAAQWLREAYDGAPSTGTAPRLTTGQTAPSPTAPVVTGADQAADMPPVVNAQSMIDTALGATPGSDISDTVTMDSALRQNEAFISEITERPNQGQSRVEVLNRLKETVGEDDDLTKAQLQTDIDRVMSEHKVDADVAAALIEESIRGTNSRASLNPMRWFNPTTRYVDHGEVKRLYDQFVNPKTKQPLEAGTAQIQTRRRQEAIQQRVQSLQTQAKAADDELRSTMSRAASGYPVNVEAAKLRHAMIKQQIQEEINKLDRDPALRANSAAMIQEETAKQEALDSRPRGVGDRLILSPEDIDFTRMRR